MKHLVIALLVLGFSGCSERDTSKTTLTVDNFKADRVVVDKTDSTMLLINNSTKEEKSYKVSFGSTPQGHKQEEGDEKTPEGEYILDFKKVDSAFYKAIHISYPNTDDEENAKQRGVNPGGAIMIHGQKNGLGWLSFVSQYFNWTDGCIAVTNNEMDEIWEAVVVGTPIIINP